MRGLDLRIPQQPRGSRAGSEAIRCPWPECDCTHTEGCVAGWIDLDDGDGRTIGVRPCARCRPELAHHMARPEDERDLRRVLPHLERTSRSKHRDTVETPWWQR